MKRQIEITIDTSGDITMDAQGFSGMGCVRATEFLENALGKLRNRRCKAEFTQTELNTQTIRNTQQ